MSATRPATEFSIGIMASLASPDFTAASASSKVLQGSASMSGKASRAARCELAPGSPWKAILFTFDLIIGVRLVELVMPANTGHDWKSGWPGKNFTRPFEVGGSIDTEGDGVNETDMNAHAGFERAELLEFLPLFERRWRQRDEALQRLPAVGIDADMVEERALAVGRGGAGEIERAQRHSSLERGAHDLNHVGVGALLLARDDRRDGADVAVVVAQGGETAPHEAGVERGQVALEIDHDLDLALGVEGLDGLEHAVGTARVIGPCHQGLTASTQDRIAHRLCIGCDHDRPATRLGRAAPDMHDHRLAGNVGKRLVRKPCRFQSGRYNDKAICHERGSWLGGKFS